MSKELVTKQSNQVAAVQTDLNEWGSAPTMGQDIIIPKILVMQPSSVLVTDGKAKMGDFCDSLTGTLMGSIVEPVDIIPFHVEKFWDIMEENDGGQFEWAKSIPLIEDPMNPGYNDNLLWKDVVDGEEIRRVRRMNFYVMLPSEIASGQSTPYLVSFKSTSFREGRKIFTQMYMRNRRAGIAPAGYTFKLSGIKQKNDKGTFIIPTVELGRASSKEEISECLSWFKLIKKGGVKVDDSDLETAVDASDVEGEDTGTGKF